MIMSAIIIVLKKFLEILETVNFYTIKGITIN